jgi:hypothetical protein
MHLCNRRLHTDIINSIVRSGVLAILLLRFQCAKVGNQVILLFFALTAKSVQGFIVEFIFIVTSFTYMLQTLALVPCHC